MQAVVGDRLIVRGHHLAEPDRSGEILEVHGAEGAAPFLVRWDDDGHVGLVFPGPDASVVHASGERASGERASGERAPARRTGRAHAHQA